MLPNGSILVIGGEPGSNSAIHEPNLEILPKPAGGETVVPLDWLARTDPFNLYPFVIVLPSKHLFVGKGETVLVCPSLRLISFFQGHYNEARILESVTFNTITQLPNIPGAVNNCAYLIILFLFNCSLIYRCLCSPRWTQLSIGR